MLKWFKKKRIISWVITILIAIEIFYFSSIPGNTLAGTSGGNIQISRTYHFIVFFLFSFFLFATINKNKKIKTKHLLIVLIISIAYAISDEIHQLFVTFRNFSIKDILTDTLGIFSSIIIYSHINQKTLKQPS